jgi:hypothetical protein
MVLDFKRLTRGERIAGVAGTALLVVMIVFAWFAVKQRGVFTGPGLTHPQTVVGYGRNAFQSFTVIDIVLLLTALVAIGSPLVVAAQSGLRWRALLSTVIAVLGAASVVLIVIRIVSPPDLANAGVHVSDVEGADVVRRIGVWLGLAAAAGVAVGGTSAVLQRETPNGPDRRRGSADS